MSAAIHVPHERATIRRPQFGLLLLIRFVTNGWNPMTVDWYLFTSFIEFVQKDPAVLGLPRLQLLLSDG